MTSQYSRPFNIRLSQAQLHQLDQIRKHTHESRSSLVRRMLQEALDQHLAHKQA